MVNAPTRSETAEPAFETFTPLYDRSTSAAIPMTPQSSAAKIAFASNRDGNRQIYLMNTDGTDQTRLTNNFANDESPKWSPDNARLVFQSDRDNPETGSRDIYVMNADGSGQTRLTFNAADDAGAVWAPDGSKIAFQSLRNGICYQIYVMNADGTNQVNITNGSSADSEPSWSVDGTKIAFASERDHPGRRSVYVMNVDGSNQTRLTFSGEPFRDEQPAWSPDANKIAFVSTRDSVIETWQETDDDGGILVRTAVRTNKEVYVMNADGTNQTRLTNTLENDDAPAWSPEVLQIVFRSDRERECCDPVAQVWLMNADGGNQINLSNNTFGDYGPSSSGITSDASPLYLGSTNYGATNPGSTVTGDSTSFPVRINFDELPNNAIVADQYYNQYGVRFSSNNFFYPLRTYQNCGFCSTTSPPNFISTIPNDYGHVTVEFTQPASDVNFYFVGLDTLSGPFGRADIYVNGSFSHTDTLRGVFNSTGGFSLASTPNVTKIIVYALTDPAGVGIDDLTFTISADVKITSARVNGYLNGTTQNALAGADIALNAMALPSGFAGGTYAWTVSGPFVFVGSANSSSVTVRSTNTGTGTATVAYTKNGLTTSGTVTINAVLPTLTSFIASQSPDELTRDGNCSLINQLGPSVVFSSGCAPYNGTPDGFLWSAQAKIAPGQYLSDPAQSGIKFRQAISLYRKIRHRGNTLCWTGRSSEENVASGWLSDGSDPWGTGRAGDIEFRRFSEGTTLTMNSFDPPAHSIERASGNIANDAFFGDDRFETYVYYFTGSNPSNPTFQRAIGFENSPLPIARLAWRWGGQVVFDPSVSFIKYKLNFSNSTQGSIASTPIDSVKDMSIPARSLEFVPCSSTNVTSNPIDDTRVFVRYHYKDFLGREPDQSGWDFWRGEITRCIFDTTCIENKRVDVSRAFFYSGEFINSVPALAASNRGTDSYNKEFVRQCYYKYLLRTCDPELCNSDGFNFWVNKLNAQYPTMGDGAYNEMIKAFIVSIEYRARPFEPLW